MEKRITFRPVQPDDLEMICRWWNDSAVMSYVGAIDYHPTLEQLENDYWPVWKNPGPGDFNMFILCLDGEAVGEIGYKLTDVEKGVADFNIKNFLRDSWGRGIGTAAMKKFLDYMFTKRGVKKVVAGIREQNTPGLSLYRRIGFTEKRRYTYEGSKSFGGGVAVEMELSAEEFNEG